MEHPIQITPEILEAFGLPRDCASTRLHGGHINDTFLVENGGKYVIQRINRYVFPSPQDIMENITGVTEFLREKILARGGDPLRETLNIRRTTQGGTLFVDEEGGPWRCMTFVDKATSHETVESPAMLREAGRAFGEFQSLLSSYPAATLHETIKDFHNTPERYRQLLEAAQNDNCLLYTSVPDIFAVYFFQMDHSTPPPVVSGKHLAHLLPGPAHAALDALVPAG